MAYPNGRVPAHARKQLPGRNAGLLKPYAYAYWAMHYRAVKLGVSLALIDGSVGRTYRDLARQYLAKRVYGPNAAVPGTSNHGLARAVDLMTHAQRSVIDRIGRPYGWAKAWSDAAWEWWHLRGVKGMGPPRKPDPFRGLTKRERLLADRLLYHRREMNREARSGKGPRYRKQLRWARYWKDRVRRQMNRLARDAKRQGGGGWKKHNRGARYQRLGRVLKATSGRL